MASNSWLAGFLDADCNFYFNWALNKLGLPISLQYYLRITQRQQYHRASWLGTSYLVIMTMIAELFSTTVTLIDRTHRNGFRELAFLVRTAKFESNYAMLSYLSHYPLLTYKYRCPDIYASVLQLSFTKAHKTADGNAMLTDLKAKSKLDPKYTLQHHLANHFYKP